jgi:hypothetical protein
MASAMNAAIRQYSIAVAPDSSARNLRKIRFDFASFQVARETPDAKPMPLQNLRLSKFRKSIS